MAVTRRPAPAKDTLVDPFGGLAGEDRDAYSAMLNTLKAYGLESLAPAVMGYLKQGYSTDTISVLLPETTEYKQRFAGNEARKKAGLPALSPAEYLSVESSYRQIMSSAGLPPGFYDEPSDFQKWIESDVSPTEIQQRVQVASDVVNSLDPAAKEQMMQWYSEGDLVAYALDRKRAATVVERQWRAAQAGGAAASQGLTISQQQAERIADTGVTAAAARQGMGAAAQLTNQVGRLSAISGQQYGQDDALAEVFFDDEVSSRRRRGLASQERARFSGSSATTAQSLSSRSTGQV